jgi:capsular polysaccharide biosynthesis protein
LAACGVADGDILWLDGLVRCKRLVMATQSLGVEQYASLSSLRLWNRVRDHSARRDISLPDRIYLSRSGMETRKLVNEAEVEAIFRRHGFTIVRPETLRGEQQTALVSNALLVAGPAGSGMFNLAFQGRLRSAFILAHEDRLRTTEMLLSTGGCCDLWYHLGASTGACGEPSREPWSVDPIRLASDVADWVAASGTQ